MSTNLTIVTVKVKDTTFLVKTGSCQLKTNSQIFPITDGTNGCMVLNPNRLLS